MESKGPRVFFVAHVGCVVVVQNIYFFLAIVNSKSWSFQWTTWLKNHEQTTKKTGGCKHD